MDPDFDTVKFILEIENRPTIWDVSTEEYRDRDLKAKCWEEITDLFGGSAFSSDEEKRVLGFQLQCKWKNLRDSQSREMRRIKEVQSGCVAKRKSPYIYANQLSFLNKCLGLSSHPTEGNGTHDFASAQAEGLLVQRSTARSSNKFNKKRKLDADDEGLVTALKASVQSKIERERQTESDEDRMFLLSLLPELKKIPDHVKLSTKMEIMRVIQKAQTVNFPGFDGYRYSPQPPAQQKQQQQPKPAGSSLTPIKVEKMNTKIKKRKFLRKKKV